MAAQMRLLLSSANSTPCFYPRAPSARAVAHTFDGSGTGKLLFSSSTCAAFSSSSYVRLNDGYGGQIRLAASKQADDLTSELDHHGDDGGGNWHGDNGGNNDGGGNWHGDNGGNNDGGGHDDKGEGKGGSYGDSVGKGGILGALLKGWKDRVETDPQFPFKVLMEEVVGVSACVLGDMASRPNFGLNELDFVFSTIMVGCILNFSLMYILAPTTAAASASIALPGIFASCPPGHMFEHGAFSVFDRLGTFVYKGAIFASVGFVAGLFGTILTNTLVSMRQKMDPTHQMHIKPPPIVLNAATWALHMGSSCNLRYQVVNGLEFALAKSLSPSAFKALVLCIRAVNNVLGGMSFVVLARLTGSQEADKETPPVKENAVDVSTCRTEEPNDVSKEGSFVLIKEDNATH